MELETARKTPFRELTDIQVKTPEDLRLVCAKGRETCNNLADALTFNARMIRTALNNYEKKSGKKLRWRARLVAAVLMSAAGYCRSAGKVCDKTYRSFLKHYEADIMTARAKAAQRRKKAA